MANGIWIILNPLHGKTHVFQYLIFRRHVAYFSFQPDMLRELYMQRRIVYISCIYLKYIILFECEMSIKLSSHYCRFKRDIEIA
jgi:hypothetical protein